MLSYSDKKDIFETAQQGKYAIGAFNAVNLETAQAIVSAAEGAQTPVMLQISDNAARYAGLAELAAISSILREKADVPILLHFDHAESLESAKAALDLGFDSVMLETAHLSAEEGVKQLQDLASYAHKRDALLEAEAEITAKDDRVQETALTPEAIAEFARASYCDLLAVDIGSEHKQTQKNTALDLLHLKAITEKTSLPLVLHGSSGVAPNSLIEAIELGITKVNVATELMLVFTNAVRDSLKEETMNDPRKYLGWARATMQERAEELIRLLKGAA